VTSCAKCGKENQDHYKFCLGCGAEISRMSSAGLPVAGAPAVGAVVAPPGPVGAGPVGPGALAGGALGQCPQCGHMNGATNLFCGSCGFRLSPTPAGSVAPAAALAPVAAAGVAGQAGPTVILTALRADGSEAGTFTLPAGGTVVGRETGGIFAADSYLSPRHATFRTSTAGITITDDGSLNGVYRKLARDIPVELAPGDVFRIGQEIVKFEPLEAPAPSPDGVERLGAPAKGYIGRIALIVGRETTGNAFPVPETGIHLGRERGDVLFPEDGYVSGLHCRIAQEGARVYLTDLGSSNGTFVRIKEPTTVGNGDVLLMGQQLFRINVTL
jgi:pSer/pThr/pTyr-binding forkhead associated (FHA) protein